MFSGLGSEFSSVQRLSIHSRIRSFTDEKDHVAYTYCEAFPGIQHVELDSNSLSRICAAFPLNVDSPQSPYPMDFWKDLETLYLISQPGPAYDHLVGWLTQRRKLGFPLLRVKLTGVDDMKHGFSYFHLYNSLKGCCNLEFNVPMPVETHYAVEADSSPLLVSIFISHKIKLTYFVIAFTWIHLGIITGAWVISRSRVEAVEDSM